MLDFIPVVSSSIDSVKYDPIVKILYVSFKSGGLYKYLDVSEDEYTNLLMAESHGKFFAAHIRNLKKFEKFTLD